MRILAITYCFVPLQYPATFRLLKWFSRLTELGHEITVVAVDPRTFQGPKDWTLQDLVPETLKTMSVPSRENTLLYRLLRKRQDIFYRLFVPWKMEWYGPAWKRLRDLDVGGYDLVLSCSQPAVCHLLGLSLRQRFGLPWVAFFSDPWADNPFHAQENEKVVERNRIIERSVIEGADAVLLTSEEQAGRLLKRYGPELGERLAVLPHCFKRDWYSRRGVEIDRASGRTEVLLTGNFYGPRSVVPLLDAVRALDQGGCLRGRLRLSIYGGLSSEDANADAWAHLEGIVRFCGRVDYLTSLALMASSDALLLMDAAVGGGDESIFFPSKLADYLGAGRPIMGITPRNGAASRVLELTGHVKCDVARSEEIEEGIVRLANGDLNWQIHPAEIERYDYRRVGDTLSAILERARVGSTVAPASDAGTA